MMDRMVRRKWGEGVSQQLDGKKAYESDEEARGVTMVENQVRSLTDVLSVCQGQEHVERIAVDRGRTNNFYPGIVVDLL